MNQSTAKNLRDLLIKQQLNSKIRFKGEPLKQSQASRKQSGNFDKKVDLSQCQCNQKNCSICIRKRSVVNASPLMKVKIVTKNLDPDSRREIKVTSSISAHQSPNREKQYQMQQMFLQKQLQSHLMQMQDQRPQSKQGPKEKRQPFYQHIESYMNNYYQKSNLSSSQLYENSYTLKSKAIPKKVESKSNVLSSTQTSFKLKLNPNQQQVPSQKFASVQQQSRSEQILNQGLSESAPNSPSNRDSSVKSKNVNDSKVLEMRRKSTADMSEKTQAISMIRPEGMNRLIFEEPIGKQHFKFLYVIGKGGFGRVWRSEMKRNKKLYALKEMSKAKIIQKRSVNSVLNEKYLLEHLHHPFLVNMWYAFQDRENLYLIIDLLTGGDLRFHLGKMRRFSENQTSIALRSTHRVLRRLYPARPHVPAPERHHPPRLEAREPGSRRGWLHAPHRSRNSACQQRKQRRRHFGDPGLHGAGGHVPDGPLCSCGLLRTGCDNLRADARAAALQRAFSTRHPRADPGEAGAGEEGGVPTRLERALAGLHQSGRSAANLEEAGKEAGSQRDRRDFASPVAERLPLGRSVEEEGAGALRSRIDDNFDFQNQISEETQLNEDQLLENQMLLRRDTVQALFEGYHYDVDLQKLQHQQTQKNTQRKSQPVSPEKKA